MKIEEQIAVMQAFAEGKEIEIYDGLKKEWVDIEKPNWDWSNCVYRIKPETKLRPYTFEELQAEMAKGKVFVKQIKSKRISAITSVIDDPAKNCGKIQLAGWHDVLYKTLLENYQWLVTTADAMPPYNSALRVQIPLAFFP